MWKALKFCIIAAIILAIAWWVASLPGSVNADAGAYQITTSTPIALLLLVLVVGLLIILFRVLGGLRRTPAQLAARRRVKRAEAGDLALQRGLVAVSAGDASGAKAASVKARSLLGDVPFAQWLSAEAARLSGQSEQAKTHFERLTHSKELKFLGHQGLLRESLKQGQVDEAAKQAEAAEAAYPGGTWTRQQRLALALQGQDYAGALRLTQEARERSALATAAAETAPTPKLAMDFAKQAVKADPASPAAIAALAKALRATGKDRAARKAVLKGWETSPNPLLAVAWFSPTANALERAQAAAQLAAANPGHLESELLLAETSLEAQLTGEARRHAEAALKAGNKDDRAAAILARLDGKPAPAITPLWRCTSCQTRQEGWAAICPACGKTGTLTASEPATTLVITGETQG